jgi:hypothetical protein
MKTHEVDIPLLPVSNEPVSPVHVAISRDDEAGSSAGKQVGKGYVNDVRAAGPWVDRDYAGDLLAHDSRAARRGGADEPSGSISRRRSRAGFR